jgi:hypothetical protein
VPARTKKPRAPVEDDVDRPACGLDLVLRDIPRLVMKLPCCVLNQYSFTARIDHTDLQCDAIAIVRGPSPAPTTLILRGVVADDGRECQRSWEARCRPRRCHRSKLLALRAGISRSWPDDAEANTDAYSIHDARGH